MKEDKEEDWYDLGKDQNWPVVGSQIGTSGLWELVPHYPCS